MLEHFEFEVHRAWFGKIAGTTNREALAKEISRWLKVDGLDYATIKSMINIFVGHDQFIRDGIPVWKSFLAQRQRLVTLVQDREKKQSIFDHWKRTTE